MEFKGIEEIEIKNWLFEPYNGETNLKFIYIKEPTAASTIDYFVSNQPMEQKMAACR